MRGEMEQRHVERGLRMVTFPHSLVPTGPFGSICTMSEVGETRNATPEMQLNELIKNKKQEQSTVIA